MDVSAFDASWWLSIAVPLAISLFLFGTSKLYWSVVRATSISYHVKEERLPHVSALVRSVVTVWNDGTSVLDNSSFASLDPLRVEARSAVNLISTKITHVSHPVSNVKLGERTGAMQIIEFEFLNPGEGFRWEGLHDGGSDCFELKGVLKGGDKHLHRRTVRINPMFKIGGLFLCIGGLIDTYSTLINVAIHKGFQSWWFWSFLPGPLLMTTAAAFFVSGFLAVNRDRGERLIDKWDKQENDGTALGSLHDA